MRLLTSMNKASIINSTLYSYSTVYQFININILLINNSDSLIL